MTEKSEEETKRVVDYPTMVLNQVNNILKLASKELRGGYQRTNRTESGGQVYIEQIYVPDTREEYSNAVEALSNLTFAHFDDKMNKANEELNEKLESYKEECMEEEFHLKKMKLNQEKYAELKLKNRRKLFRELCSFWKRKNYFKEE